MNTLQKENKRSQKDADRIAKLDQKVELLLQKVEDLESILSKISRHYQPLIK